MSQSIDTIYCSACGQEIFVAVARVCPICGQQDLCEQCVPMLNHHCDGVEA